MTLDSAIRIGIGGLNAAQFGLTQTTNNIANVNTPGYVRREVQFETRVAGTEASGVQVAGVRRVIDLFLEAVRLWLRTKTIDDVRPYN